MKNHNDSLGSYMLIIIGLLFIIAFCGGCAVTPRAAIRARAEGKLGSCLKNSVTEWHKMICVEESKKFCRDNQLETSCGIDGLWGR